MQTELNKKTTSAQSPGQLFFTLDENKTRSFF